MKPPHISSRCNCPLAKTINKRSFGREIITKQNKIKDMTTTDKNEIEGEEGVNAYKGIFLTFAYEICGHIDKQLLA